MSPFADCRSTWRCCGWTGRSSAARTGPAPALTAKSGGQWIVKSFRNNNNGCERSVDEPAGTLRPVLLAPAQGADALIPCSSANGPTGRRGWVALDSRRRPFRHGRETLLLVLFPAARAQDDCGGVVERVGKLQQFQVVGVGEPADVVKVVLAGDRDDGARQRAGRQRLGPVAEAGQAGGVEVHRVLLARRVADSAAWSMCTASSSGRGIAVPLVLAAQDGADRRAADQVGQAADHAAGALVQLSGLGGQGAGLVVVQPQGGFAAPR